MTQLERLQQTVEQHVLALALEAFNEGRGQRTSKDFIRVRAGDYAVTIIQAAIAELGPQPFPVPEELLDERAEEFLSIGCYWLSTFEKAAPIIRELQAEVKRLEQIIESTTPKEKN